jgi:hypothetical protein
MKKTWETPKLLVLTRGRAEEAILQNCKTSSTTAVINYGPSYSYMDCSAVEQCPECNQLGMS